LTKYRFHCKCLYIAYIKQFHEGSVCASWTLVIMDGWLFPCSAYLLADHCLHIGGCDRQTSICGRENWALSASRDSLMPCLAAAILDPCVFGASAVICCHCGRIAICHYTLAGVEEELLFPGGKTAHYRHWEIACSRAMLCP